MTRSQKATAKKIHQGLANREIVCLFGRPDGKTHTFMQLVGQLSVGPSGKLRGAMPSQHSEDFKVEIIEGLEVPTQSHEVRVSAFRRMLLDAYGVKPCTGLKRVIEFNRLLLDLRKERIIPAVAMDCIELMPRKGFSLLKMMNEVHVAGQHVGVAALLSGDFTQQRMPSNFWGHIYEVKIEKISLDEVEEFLQHLVPQHAKNFTLDAVKKLSQCESTLEMKKMATNAVRAMQYSDLDAIDSRLLSNVEKSMFASRARLAA